MPGSSKYRPAKSPEKKITGHHFAIKFQDAFTGSSVDTATWSPQMPWGTAAADFLQRYREDALSTSGGALVIKADFIYKPIQFACVWRCERDQGGGAGCAVSQEGGTRQCVRTTSRTAYHGKPLDSVGVGYGGDVDGGVGYAAVGQPVRPAITRPVESYQPHAQAIENRGTRARAKPASRRAVKQENRHPTEITSLLNGKTPSVWGYDRIYHRGGTP